MSSDTSKSNRKFGSLSITIPCHNEETGLDALVDRVKKVATTSFGTNYEIILVDDGSTDNTWDKIFTLSKTNEKIKGLKLSRNFGHQSALTAALAQAQGDCVFILDADLQDPPELLSQMLSKLEEGYEVAFGQRESRDGERWFKRTSAKLFYKFINRLSETDLPKDTGDYRLMSRKALISYLSLSEYHRYTRGMITWIGFKQIGIKYKRAARHSGTTSYPLRKMLSFALDAVTSFSIVPLRLCGLIGVFSIVISLAIFLYVLASFFSDGYVKGWASLAGIVTFFASAQLISLSVIGEYLGRIFMQVKQRPQYIISDTTFETLENHSHKMGVHQSAKQ